ncbi:MAG: arylsulfatase [Spirochaetia bacterium]
MQEKSRPNIIVILVDDMGYSDIGCYGSEIRTPNLNGLARDGVRFSQMYNCARCCPTRASLLTGLHPHQAGVGHMISDRGAGPAYQGFLRQDCVTIGEVLKDAGYRTMWSGKWHTSAGLPLVGEPQDEPGSLRNPYPLSRGFDRFYGTLGGAGSFFNPVRLMEQDKRIEPGADYYYTDGISDAACRMIEEASDGDDPFFLHVCYTAPHWPLHALPEDIERYRGKYRKGWDYLRTSRHEELKGSGILDSKWDISPRDTESRDFTGDPKDRQEWEDLRMAVYAAQVDRMDQGVGKILGELSKQGIEDNTMVMFLSDNGGCAEFLNEDGDMSTWPQHYGVTAREGETCRVGNVVGLEPGPATTFMSYDLPWANASNTPFRLYKHWVHEGGISTPFICRWPGKTDAGSIYHQPCHVSDILATCIEAAGAGYPKEHDDHDIQPLEGESFAPLLSGDGEWHRERPIFWEHEGNRAVRDGSWKLVSKTVDGENGPWELYDMNEDRTELSDLAAKDPGRVKNMAAMYNQWAERCGVLPWKNGPVRV